MVENDWIYVRNHRKSLNTMKRRHRKRCQCNILIVEIVKTIENKLKEQHEYCRRK